MEVLAIIPARGGSKGVPRKNVRLLGNKPLIVYSIDAAQQSGIFKEVFVSTDDLEIAAVSEAAGVAVPFLRPAELAQDQTPMLDVVKHVLSYFAGIGKTFDAVCLLQPTTPFRTAKQIKDAFSKFKTGDFDSLVSVLQVPDKYNPHWQFIDDGNKSIRLFNGEKQPIARRQDLPKTYIREGSIYIFKPATVEKHNNIYGDEIAYYLVEEETVNIDTEEDFEKAVIKLGMR